MDASYAVHIDMKIQTGGEISMVLRVTLCKSSKKKLKIKRSTESELVDANDYVPCNIWYILFIYHQAYLNKSNNFFQYNQSAIRMDINGINSCTGNSRHINIRYFLIKDRVERGELSIMYCPKYLMLADYFTKTQQGKLCSLFRDIVIGGVSPYTLIEDIVSYLSKERV